MIQRNTTEKWRFWKRDPIFRDFWKRLFVAVAMIYIGSRYSLILSFQFLQDFLQISPLIPFFPHFTRFFLFSSCMTIFHAMKYNSVSGFVVLSARAVGAFCVLSSCFARLIKLGAKNPFYISAKRRKLPRRFLPYRRENSCKWSSRPTRSRIVKVL